MMQRFHFERIALFTCWLAAASLLGEASEPGQRPPWQGQYKIRPSETGRLTEADVVGPDGIVYPNWTRTGVQGGIPRIEPAATIEEFGGQADDDQDDEGDTAHHLAAQHLSFEHVAHEHFNHQTHR